MCTRRATGPTGLVACTPQLRRDGHEVNIKRVERLMRVGGHPGRVRAAQAAPGGEDGVLGVDGVRVWPDLVKRDFQPAGPNELWCSDMKQIPTGEGVLHLASRAGLLLPPDRGLGDGPGRRRAAGRPRAARWPSRSAGRARGSSITPTVAVSTRRSRSARRAARTGSRSPTAARAARTTTPPRRASSPRLRRSGCAGARSPPTSRRAARSSSTSRSSTTARRLHSTLGYRSPDEVERDHHLTLVVAEAV